MKTLTKATCSLLLIGTLCIAGCGGKKTPPSTSFSKIYQTASMAEQYNPEMEQASINVVDALMVHNREALDMIIAIQKKIDNGDTEFVQKIKDFTISSYARYHIRLQSYSIQPLSDNKGFSLYGRPTKFYLLLPDKEGKFGDHNTAILREINSFISKSDNSTSADPVVLTSDGALLPQPLMNDQFQSQEAIWTPSRQELSILWTKDKIYLMSGIHDDKKNHNSVCILSTPGDIAEGMINGTFPFKEDMSSELLQSFLTFYNDIFRYLPEDVTKQLYVPDRNDKDFIAMSNDDSAFLYAPSLKKLNGNGGDKVYSFQMRFTTGPWARMKLRTIYIRFRQDGTREWSFNDGQDYYKLNVEWIKNMANYIAQKEGIK